MDNLPPAIWLEIAVFLPVESLFSLAQVGRRYRATLQDRLEPYRLLPTSQRFQIVKNAQRECQLRYLLHHVLIIDPLSFYVVAECIGKCGSVHDFKTFRQWTKQRLSDSLHWLLTLARSAVKNNNGLLVDHIGATYPALKSDMLGLAMVHDREGIFRRIQESVDVVDFLAMLTHEYRAALVNLDRVPAWLRTALVTTLSEGTFTDAQRIALDLPVDRLELPPTAETHSTVIAAAILHCHPCLQDVHILAGDRYQILLAVRGENMQALRQMAKHADYKLGKTFWPEAISQAIACQKPSILAWCKDYHAKYATAGVTAALKIRDDALANYFAELVQSDKTRGRTMFRCGRTLEWLQRSLLLFTPTLADWLWLLGPQDTDDDERIIDLAVAQGAELELDAHKVLSNELCGNRPHLLLAQFKHGLIPIEMLEDTKHVLQNGAREVADLIKSVLLKEAAVE